MAVASVQGPRCPLCTDGSPKASGHRGSRQSGALPTEGLSFRHCRCLWDISGRMQRQSSFSSRSARQDSTAENCRWDAFCPCVPAIRHGKQYAFFHFHRFRIATVGKPVRATFAHVWIQKAHAVVSYIFRHLGGTALGPQDQWAGDNSNGLGTNGRRPAWAWRPRTALAVETPGSQRGNQRPGQPEALSNGRSL